MEEIDCYKWQRKWYPGGRIDYINIVLSSVRPGSPPQSKSLEKDCYLALNERRHRLAVASPPSLDLIAESWIRISSRTIYRVLVEGQFWPDSVESCVSFSLHPTGEPGCLKPKALVLDAIRIGAYSFEGLIEIHHAELFSSNLTLRRRGARYHPLLRKMYRQIW